MRRTLCNGGDRLQWGGAFAMGRTTPCNGEGPLQWGGPLGTLCIGEEPLQSGGPFAPFAMGGGGALKKEGLLQGEGHLQGEGIFAVPHCVAVPPLCSSPWCPPYCHPECPSLRPLFPPPMVPPPDGASLWCQGMVPNGVPNCAGGRDDDVCKLNADGMRRSAMRSAYSLVFHLLGIFELFRIKCFMRWREGVWCPACLCGELVCNV